MKSIPLLGLLALLSGALSAPAINISANGSYSQNFNTLAQSGVTNVWTNDSILGGGWFAESVTPFGNYSAGTGSSSTADLWSFGPSANSDRALGSLGGGATGNVAWGVSFTNTANATVRFDTLSFVGEQWRNGGDLSGNFTQNVTFSYRTDASPITSLTPSSDVGWTQVPGLTFTNPNNIPGSAGGLDGNVSGNRTLLSRDFFTLGEPIFVNVGHTIMFRWLDIDHSGGEHGLAIDDFSVAFTVIPEPGSAALLVAGLGLLLARNRRDPSVRRD